MPFIVVDNLNLYFRSRRSVRVKRLQLRLHGDGFEIVAPRRSSNREIIAFVWASRHWMVRVHNRRAVRGIDTVWDTHKNKLYYRGQYWWMSFSKGEAFKIDFTDENKMICTLPDEKNYQSQLEQWFKTQTQEVVHSVVQSNNGTTH